eukprot:jgi/Botrbrau1/14347/Bobra.0014s0004.1
MAGFVSQLRQRETSSLSGPSRLMGQPFLQTFSSAAPDGGTVDVDPGGQRVPPLVIRYNKRQESCKYLAIGDEEGFVSILNTFAPLPASLSSLDRRPSAQWLAHNNAIFDVAWSQDDTRMLTASGDQSVGVWDTQLARCISFCGGHDGSVKTVSYHPQQLHVFASGGRDGHVKVWDTRVGHARGESSDILKSVLTIKDAHKSEAERSKAHKDREKRGRNGMLRSIVHSVTSALFLPQGSVLATAGDKDGVVRLWDLRMLQTDLPNAFGQHYNAPHSTAIGSAAQEGERPHGITCLSLSPQEDTLLVSLSQGPHLLYPVNAPEAPPIAEFTGHESHNFYLRACFSSDGSHILSGSADRKAYIYEVARPEVRYVLEGHQGEVTCVGWCPTSMDHLATAGDDCVVRCWKLPEPYCTMKESDVVVKRPKSSCRVDRPMPWLAPLTPTLGPQSQSRHQLPAITGTRPLSALGSRPTSVPTIPTECASAFEPAPAVEPASEPPTHAARPSALPVASGGVTGVVQAPSMSYALDTVKQLNRIRTDWKTPPASLFFNGDPSTGSSSKRKFDSSSRKLVQRSLLDYMVPSEPSSSRGSKMPRLPFRTPTSGNKANREDGENSELSYGPISSARKAGTGLLALEALASPSFNPGTHCENKRPEAQAADLEPGAPCSVDNNGMFLQQQLPVLRYFTGGAAREQPDDVPLAQVDMNRSSGSCGIIRSPK